MGKILEIGFALFALILAVFFIIPTANNISSCFALTSTKIQTLPSALEVGKDAFCKDGQDALLSLKSCLQQAKNKNILAPLFFRLSLMLPSIKNSAKTIEKHNQVCPQYPVPPIFSNE